ncbi:MAG TPA: hypothetical protein VGF28_24070 [Thermoanaerobaculia bacterium]|jgi:hypothetical protein
MKDRVYALSFTTPLARWLSIAGHPFVLIPLTVGASTRSLFWAAVIAASTTLPLLAIIIRNVRKGRWSDADVSRHDQRSGLYHAGLPILLLSALVLYVLGADPRLLRGIAAGVAMAVAGLIGNRWLKISMHMMFAAFCAVAISRAYPGALTVAAATLFLAALAWSRNHLKRHTWPEIATGLALGLLAGAAAAA